MEDRISEAYPQCSENICFETKTDTTFEIEDQDNGRCIILNNEESGHFTVKNPNNKTISFLSIDKCIFFDDDEHKKCDFAICDDQTFCFVEIKNTTTRSTKRKQKATEQLMTTIEMIGNEADLSQFDLEAIISWKYKPRRPAVSTNMASKKVLFKTKLNTTLVEGNQKEFV